MNPENAGSLLWNTLLPALLSAAAPALLWALKKLGDYFKAKAAAADASMAEQKIFGALDQLDQIAAAVVTHLNTNVKEKLTTYLADGVLSEAEKADLKASAMSILTSEAGPKAFALLKASLGDAFELVVSGAIEKAVKAANKERLARAAQAGTDAAAKIQNLADAADLFSGGDK